MFYKLDYTGEILSAPTVYHEDYTLLNSKDSADGWSWFDSEEEAISNLVPNSIKQINDEMAALKKSHNELMNALSSASTFNIAKKNVSVMEEL